MGYSKIVNGKYRRFFITIEKTDNNRYFLKNWDFDPDNSKNPIPIQNLKTVDLSYGKVDSFDRDDNFVVIGQRNKVKVFSAVPHKSAKLSCSSWLSYSQTRICTHKIKRSGDRTSECTSTSSRCSIAKSDA